jgi:hypothetical protein
MFLSENTQFQNHKDNNNIVSNIILVSIVIRKAQIVGNRIENK